VPHRENQKGTNMSDQNPNSQQPQPEQPQQPAFGAPIGTPTPEYSMPPTSGEPPYIPQPQQPYDYSQQTPQPQQPYDYSQQAPQPQQPYDYSQQQYSQQQYAQQAQQAQSYQPSSAASGWGSAEKDKWVAAVLAFALGFLGIHKFYLGYKSEGMVMLLVSIIGSLCVGLGPLVMTIIALIEAVKYVILTQEDFQATYVVGRKAWL
jgi:TM2 domain-containing membrane protein YozV